MWSVAELDDAYIAQMEDVLALYEKPYQAAEPVVCLDEKPVALHADVRPPRPAQPGRIAKRDNEYKRCGTANIFAVVEPKAGRHFTRATPDRSAFQFAQVIRDLVSAYPFARTIHLVMDQYPLPKIPDRSSRRARGKLHMESSPGPPHSQTRQLAQSS